MRHRVPHSELSGREGRDLRPPLDHDLPLADVDRHDEGVAEASDGVFEEPRGEGGGADHHPVGACVERRCDRLERAVPTAHLQRQRARTAQPLDEIEARHARERAVEVDEVEAPRSLRREPPRELDGVSALEGDHVALASR